MFLSYFGPVFRHSIQTMCTVCFRENFLRFLEGVRRIFNKKTFPKPLYSHDGRVICAAQHCKMLHVKDLAVHKPFSGSCNFLRGTKYFVQETMNSLRGTNIVFRDKCELPLGNKIFPSGNDEFPSGNKYCLSRHKCELPLGNKIFPSGNYEFLSGNKYCLSRHKCEFPSGNKIFPVGNEEFPSRNHYCISGIWSHK